MDRNKFSAIAHRNHAFSNPISESKINMFMNHTKLNPNDKAIDIGAGTSELLIRYIEKYNISATAIELYEGSIESARNRANGRIALERIQFVNEDAKQAIDQFSTSAFRLGICIGSTHAIGDLAGTLQALRKCVQPGGYILVGEGYWKKTPSNEYLQALGAQLEDLTTHHGNVKLGEQMGLTPLFSVVASEDDWDAYEGLYASSIEEYCYENPDDPDVDAMLTRIRSWRNTYLEWGRDTLGFGLYLFRK
ncbi:class I SAM-dependent methyltransferase [Brevibacillus nitrificans]|uniref:class I SAM-dependent methyltransferase n=1 Tax=Brevibacillus nitrificans TaxID=651560 RepID=UPI0026156EE9|nr:class I SAM-dependent methyltransferase [Brevibacillus nitrificans]